MDFSEKEALLTYIRKQPVTYSELLLHFKVTPNQLTNNLNALKKAKLVKIDQDFKGRFKPYIAIDLETSYQDWWEEQAAKRKEYRDNAISPYATYVGTADDYHTKGSREKQCAWIGTTFGTMDY